MEEMQLHLPDRTSQMYELAQPALSDRCGLWDKAVQRLDDYDKKRMNLRADHRTVLVDLLNIVTERQQACVGKQWKYTKRNGDVVVVRDMLSQVIGGIKRFQEIGDIAVQYDPAHAALPWAGVRMLLKIAINDSEAHAAMIDGVEYVSRLIVRYAVVEAMYLQPAKILQDQLEVCITELYVGVLRYLAKAREYYDRPTAARLSRSILQGSSSVEKSLAVITNSAKKVDEVVTLIEADFARTKERLMVEGFIGMSDGFLGVYNRLDGIAQKLRPLLYQQPIVSRKELLAWLNAVYTDEEWENALRSRTPHTCEWIQERPMFKEWIQGSGSNFLWINGNPGFGKTVLSAHIVEYLRQEYPNRVAHFFCTSAHESKRRPLAIVRSWLAQMTNNPDGLEVIQDLYQGKEGREATTADVWRIFRRVCERVDGFFVVDGLDECAGDRQIPQFLSDLAVSACRTLLVSRPHTDIRTEYRRLAETSEWFREYEIVPADTENDISSFSANMVAARLPKKPNQLKDQMTLEVSQRSHGMFLWVRLLGERLNPTENAKELRKIVNEMPKEIEETYASELRRIDNLSPRDRNRAAAILKWMLFAQRPLTVREVTEARVVQDDYGDEYPAEDLPDTWEEEEVNDDIQRLCGSLITMQGREEQRPSREQTIHFVHFSVREYLSTVSLPISSLSPANEHDILAQACLRYLCYPEIAGEKQYPGETVTEKIKNYGFLDYAAHFWYVHARNAAWLPELLQLTNRLFNPSARRWILWSRMVGGELSNDSNAANTNEDVSSLYYTALLGFMTPLHHLIEQGCDINDAGAAGSPLHGAVIGGQMEVIRVLLDHGAKLDVPNRSQAWLPLHHAAFGGRLAISELLIAHGADAGCIASEGWTPLYLAADSGYLDITKLLLKQHVNVNVPDDRNNTPLHVAAYRGHLDIVQLLIEHGAEVSVRNKDGCTPLHLAARGGHLDIVQLLIEHGAEISATDEDSWTPLHLAIWDDHLDIIQLLIERGAEIDAIAQNSYTPLHLAARCGHLEIVQLLIEHGAEISATYEDGWMPLHLATKDGHLDIVQLLIEHGAKICSTDEDGWTPLHLAARGGHLDIVQLLIEHGAGISATDEDGWTPLHFAIWGDHLDIMQLLIEHGAEVNATNKDGWMPLHLASRGNYLEVVQLLIEHGAEVNATIKDGRTALHLAARGNHLDIMQLLIGHGAEIDAIDEDGCTPLHFAMWGDPLDSAQLLIEHGAEISATDETGRTPLHHAAMGSHLQVTKLLIQRTADPKSCLAGGNSPLHSLSRNGDFGGSELSCLMDMLQSPMHLAAYAGHKSVVQTYLDHGVDATMVDGYGRSVADWIAMNPAIFSNMAEHPRTSDKARMCALYSSTVRLAKRILAETKPEWYELGNCLLLLTELDDARTCFLHGVQVQDGVFVHPTRCDLCENSEKMITGSRFVCHTCPEVDLCATCMLQYPQPERVPHCRDHDFFKLRPRESEVFASTEAGKVEEFLQSLVTRYEVHEGNLE